MPALSSIYSGLIRPNSELPDDRRQELILNIILVGVLGAALAALLVATINYFSNSIEHFAATFTVNIVFTLGIASLLVLSRSGRPRIAATIFITLLSLVSLQTLFQFGFMLPSALLLVVLIIVIAGVLLGARQGLFCAAAAAFTILLLSYLEQQGSISPDTSWLTAPFHVGDAIGYSVVLLMVGLISWLSNREIDRSLQRARKSELALAAERDNLELKVAERTRELEDTQLVRLMELQRFAEFGRLSANLLHEIANPLTAASLNLELSQPGKSSLVLQAQKNLKHLERYIEAARQQLRGSGSIKSFSTGREIKQLLRMLVPRAASAGIKINYHQAANYRLLGDPVKFSQLIANLLVNAVDAYAHVKKPDLKREIMLAVSRDNNYIVCSVTDYGIGLSKDQLGRIFEPFYTTKNANKRSLGIGLAMVQQYVEKDFNGQVSVTSSKLAGTTFTVRLRQEQLRS